MKVLLIAILSFLSVALSAQTISEEDALQEAQKFIHAQNTRATGHRKFANGSTLSLIKTGMAPESKKSAEQGLKEAQAKMGVLYSEGRGVKQSDAESFKWHLKAAEQGNDQGQYELGLCYYQGLGVEIDYKEAFKWFLKAAEQGHAKAQCYVGDSYQDGEGVEENIEKAIEWYQKAANQGAPEGKSSLGLCYRSGIGFEQDYNMSFKLFREAALKDEPMAQYLMGKRMKMVKVLRLTGMRLSIGINYQQVTDILWHKLLSKTYKVII